MGQLTPEPNSLSFFFSEPNFHFHTYTGRTSILQALSRTSIFNNIFGETRLRNIFGEITPYTTFLGRLRSHTFKGDYVPPNFYTVIPTAEVPTQAIVFCLASPKMTPNSPGPLGRNFYFNNAGMPSFTTIFYIIPSFGHSVT